MTGTSMQETEYEYEFSMLLVAYTAPEHQQGLNQILT